VIHSRAFRRLEYKTQFSQRHRRSSPHPPHPHDRSGRHLAQHASALKLNTDLAETIALAHDLGHSPFGHKGETVLAARADERPRRL